MTRIKLFVHAGRPKCASSTVRRLLLHAGGFLAGEGIFLLDHRLNLSPGNDIADWPLWLVEDAVERPKGYLTDAIAASVQSHRGMDIRALVLSAENLSDPAKSVLLTEAIDQFDVHLVYYMHRQDHFLVSSWRQWAMKRGVSLEQHIIRRMAEGRPDFEALLSFWREQIGVDHIHARFVAPQFLSGGFLAEDLFAALGCAGRPHAMVEAENVSPDRAVLPFLGRRPELLDSVHDDRVVQLLAEFDEGPAERIAIGRHLQKSLKMAYEPANQRILRGYGRRQDIDVPVIVEDAESRFVDGALTPRDMKRLEAIFVKLLRRAVEPSIHGAAQGGLNEQRSRRTCEKAQPQRVGQPHMMRVSVIIPAKNAGPIFAEVLNAVARQETSFPVEVIVVDSGSSDGTLQEAQRRQNVRTIEIAPEAFGHGRTRNYAVSQAAGDLIAFLTHDAVPVGTAWLSSLVAAVTQSADIAGAFGRHVAHDGASPFTKRDLELHFANFANYPAVLSQEYRPGAICIGCWLASVAALLLG